MPIFRGGGNSPNPYGNGDDGMKDHGNTEGYERCVICGKLTEISVSTPIDMRSDYEIGCGQICAECVDELRNKEKFTAPQNLPPTEKGDTEQDG